MVVVVLKKVNENNEMEYSLIGATGTHYNTTKELKLMNLNKAMTTVGKKE